MPYFDVGEDNYSMWAEEDEDSGLELIVVHLSRDYK